MMLRLLALLCLFASTSHAQEEIVLGLSHDSVAITATFEGSEILIFGAIRRETALPDGKLGVIVTVAGPDIPTTVFRKEKRLGIWVNVDDVTITSAPSFYAVASSAPLTEILRPAEDLTNRISIRQAVYQIGATVLDSRSFSRALIRIRKQDNLYQTLEGAVDFSRETLFNTSIAMPANLTEGSYTTRIFLTRDGTIVDSYTATIPVRKVGMERWLYNLAHEQALLYGLMSLAIAIASGWLASAAFGLLRR